MLSAPTKAQEQGPVEKLATPPRANNSPSNQSGQPAGPWHRKGRLQPVLLLASQVARQKAAWLFVKESPGPGDQPGKKATPAYQRRDRGVYAEMQDSHRENWEGYLCPKPPNVLFQPSHLKEQVRTGRSQTCSPAGVAPHLQIGSFRLLLPPHAPAGLRLGCCVISVPPCPLHTPARGLSPLLRAGILALRQLSKRQSIHSGMVAVHCGKICWLCSCDIFPMWKLLGIFVVAVGKRR